MKAAGIEYASRSFFANAKKQPENTDHSSGSPPNLLCLHGIGGDHNSFLPQLENLADVANVIAWNMPGYRSSDPLKDLTFPALASKVIDLLDALNLPSVHLAGQSIGGMLAIEVALRFPERVKSLVLVATTSAFGGRDDSFRQQFLHDRLAPLERGESMETIAATAIDSLCGASTSQAVREQAVASMAGVSPDTWRAILRCLVTFDRRDSLKTLGQPVCLIAGSEDTNAPARTMHKMALQLAESALHSEYHCIEGAGHLVNLEQPGKVDPIIRRFLRGMNPIS